MGRLASLLLKEASKQTSQWNSQQVATISPSPMDLIRRVTVGLKLSPSDTVIDLGCGDGRWLIHMASCSSCQCWGVEIDSNRLQITGERINEENLRSLIELIQVDLYAMDLSKFSVVIVYLSREGNENLKEKILQECFCHTSIIAVGFSFRGWIPHEVYQGDQAGSGGGGISAFHYRLSDQIPLVEKRSSLHNTGVVAESHHSNTTIP